MCGIFGIVATTDAPLKRAHLSRAVQKLYLLAESRGKEAAGLAAVLVDSVEVVKRPIRGRKFVKDPDFIRVLNNAVTASADAPLVLVGHTRMVTNGNAEDHGNNQPVVRNELICVHNGIIINDLEIWESHPEITREQEVDTDALLALIESKRRAGLQLSAAVAAALDEAKGANSIALVAADTEALILSTTNGSLFFATSMCNRALLFASELYILEQAIKASALALAMIGAKPVQLQPREAALIKFSQPQPIGFSLMANSKHPRSDELEFVDIASKRSRKVIDHSPAFRPCVPQLHNGAWQEIEGLMSVNMDRVLDLKRCTKCVLPETFPFIEFDAAGVCQYCRNHKPLQLYREQDLLKIFEPVDQIERRPKCLVPLSGGRDSCYGLHYLKSVLGLNPVAYTYDWGMVTDLARRNISRMCGALGVEHILIAADIRRKREFIRSNVVAWMKRPRLGTIPLFMAGDKQFYYYADLLQRQMKLDSIIFSANPLERTFFKVGFCGINDPIQRERLQDLSLLNVFKLGLYYARQFALNPAYLNQSLCDTAFAYFCFYLMPKHYYQLYDYVEWDEKTINNTLRSIYDWEIASDSKSTWRIGDGTSAFYNYIYLRVKGFTEHDTFRSNQIREGKMLRAEALDIVREENRPRPEGFRWYCDTIGLDAAAALRVINGMRRL